MQRILTVLLLALAAPAVAQTMPAGEYSMTVTGAGRNTTATRCMAETNADAAMQPKGQDGMSCSRRDIKRSGNTITYDWVCDGMKMRGTGVVETGSYRSDMTMEIEGIPPMHIVTEVKRLGACKPGQTPATGF